MKTPSPITVESRVEVPVNLLEYHVNSKHHPRECDEQQSEKNKKLFSDNFENLHWCTEELLIDGSVEIYMINGSRFKYLSIPVETGFLVVCTKGNEGHYKVNWSSSLS